MDYLAKLEQPEKVEKDQIESLELRLAKAKLEEKVREEVEEDLKRSGDSGLSSDVKVFVPHGFKHTSSCFAHALVNHHKDQIQRELISQDAVTLSLLLHESRVEKFTCAVQVLRLLLTPWKKHERIEEELMKTILAQFEKGLEEEWTKRKKDLFIKMKRIEVEEQQKSVNKLDKAKQLTEQEILASKDSAIKDTQAQFISESNKVLDRSLEALQLTLRGESDLNPEEVSSVMSEFKLHLNSLENLICDNLTQQHVIQRRILDKRKKSAFSQCAKRLLTSDVQYNRLDTMTSILASLTSSSNSKLTGRNLEEAIVKYEESCMQSILKVNEEQRQSLQELSNKLAEEREQKLKELEEQLYNYEKDEFFGQSAKSI